MRGLAVGVGAKRCRAGSLRVVHHAVAVTGASGFIGSRIVRALAGRGVGVRALVRPGGILTGGPHVEPVTGSLEDDVALAELVEGASVVVHCAGVVRGTDYASFGRVNVEGTRRIVCAALAACCQRFVLISSLAAREPSISPYAASKHAAELMLQETAADLDWTIVRPPAVYGPGDKELTPLFRLMSRGLALQFGPQDSRFSLLHVDDLADAVTACVHGDVGQSVLTLDDGRPGGYDWQSVIGIAESLWGRRILRLPLPKSLMWLPAAGNYLAGRLLPYRPMLTPGKLREFHHRDWVCGNDLITAKTGWRPRRDLAAGLRSLRLR